MRVLIYGAGVIGSLYAALFSEAGVDTSVYARGERLETLRRSGLRYEKNGAVCTANVCVLDALHPNDIYDFIFLTVRENQLHEALAQLRENQSPCVVTMVNSIEDYDMWEQLCGDGQILPAFPGAGGGFENGVHISNVDMIVEGSNPTIAEMGGGAAATDVDEAVAKLIVDEIPDGACLQLGIGGMPNAVGSLIAKSDLKDLGVHTEMYVDAFVDIAAAGKITGAHKALDKGRQVYAFGAGTKKLYDYLNNNPACMSAPVDYTNDVRTIAALDNFMSINNAVDLDLFGQVNAESAGIKHISGAGGQLDFVLGAYLSKGGKSFICCSSTFKNKAGELQSRILPTLNQGSIVTDTRANLHYLVTEYGKVNLKGLATWQKCEAIISVAHPQFRDQLIKEAEKMHIWRQSNKI